MKHLDIEILHLSLYCISKCYRNIIDYTDWCEWCKYTFHFYSSQMAVVQSDTNESRIWANRDPNMNYTKCFTRTAVRMKRYQQLSGWSVVRMTRYQQLSGWSVINSCQDDALSTAVRMKRYQQLSGWSVINSCQDEALS